MMESRDNIDQRSGARRTRCLLSYSMVLLLLSIAGCGTTTTRSATEQLLMSDAVDNAIAQIDFRVLQGKKVFIDTAYLRPVPAVGFVNSEYITSSLRQQLTAARCLIQDKRDTADVIIEPRVGALGTDGHEVVYGIPQSGALVNAAAAFSSSPIPALPEISFGKSNAQTGIAKVIVFAYDRESREAIWQSGVAKAESSSRNTWYLGAGPFQKGSIHEGTRFAGQSLPEPPAFHYAASQSESSVGDTQTPGSVGKVSYHQPAVFEPASKVEPDERNSPQEADRIPATSSDDTAGE